MTEAPKVAPLVSLSSPCSPSPSMVNNLFSLWASVVSAGFSSFLSSVASITGSSSFLSSVCSITGSSFFSSACSRTGSSFLFSGSCSTIGSSSFLVSGTCSTTGSSLTTSFSCSSGFVSCKNVNTV